MQSFTLNTEIGNICRWGTLVKPAGQVCRERGNGETEPPNRSGHQYMRLYFNERDKSLNIMTMEARQGNVYTPIELVVNIGRSREVVVLKNVDPKVL